MQPRTETRIADWERRSVADGYAGLHELIESGFSGAITASGATLFVLDGRTVGLADGTIATFEAAALTARTAPHPALPLLFAMQERGGETRATYYTNDTPISEAAATLEDGGFTGYVELSENVLSGDYYLVYHQGRSMSVGFVGSSDRLVVGEEADSRLHDEVGIYTVEAVDIAEIEIPEPTAADADGGRPADPTADIDSADDEPSEPTAPIEEAGSATAPGAPSASSQPEEPSNGASMDADPKAESDDESSFPTTETPDFRLESADSGPIGENETPAASASDPGSAREASPDRANEPTEPQDRWGSVIDEPVEDRIAAEQQWRETTRIPSLEPQRSTTGSTGSGATVETTAAESTETTAEPSEEMLSRALDTLEAERDARQDAERTIEELRGDVERLEKRLDDAENATPTGDPEPASEPESTPDRSLDPKAALSGVNLFVRYASKGAATLETAHAGEVDREALAENLRLERRTEFDAEAVAVEGEPFATFFTDRLEYRFAEWLVSELPFELAETGRADSLGALYDALPEIDRIEFRGTVEDDEGEPRSFDVICRGRMGEPLVVTDCVDTRAATDETAVATLVENATETKRVAPELAGAMMVTTSYFDPGALSTAEEATRSGLLGGGSRESYVTISRRAGYHLCLLEMYDGTFHVSVPEL